MYLARPMTRLDLPPFFLYWEVNIETWETFLVVIYKFLTKCQAYTGLTTSPSPLIVSLPGVRVAPEHGLLRWSALLYADNPSLPASEVL